MAIKNILVSKKKRYEQRTIQAECFAKNGCKKMKFEQYITESETTLLKLLKKYVEADKKQSASLEPSSYTGSDVKLKHKRGTQAPVTKAMRALRKEWEKQGRDWANLPAWINKNKEKV